MSSQRHYEGTTAAQGSFAGQAWIIVNSDLQGRALATLTLGPAAGITNNVGAVTAPGNVNTVRFSASAETPGDPAATLISGVVLDNTDVPIEGVTVSVEGAAIPPAVTDAEGQFVIASAPVGAVKVLVDGTTTTRAGEWPHLEYDVVTLPGRNNTVGQPIYLLPIDVPNGLAVSETVGGMLTIPDVPGLSLTVEPGTATFPGGSKSGVISATVVHADKVPMTPNFGQQPRLVLTIQPSGVIFDPPARITYPNLDGLAPGAITELYSFDHDLGQFVGIGTATVTEDGLLVESDPGVGVIKGGWHCEGNPAPTGECEPVRVLVTSFSPLIIEQGSTETASAIGLPDPGQYEWTTSDETAAALSDTQSPAVGVQGGAGLANLNVRFTNDDSGNEATATVQALSGTVTFQSQVIDQDDPENQQFESVSESEPIYGGSVAETSDDLQLMVDLPPTELRDKVTKFEWSVEGDGAEEYQPPDPGPDQDAWEVGDVRPNPGTLKFQVSVTFEGGTVINKSREFDVGIRTDDVAAIDYIDPVGVDLDQTDVGSDVLQYFPVFGFGPLDPEQKLKTGAYLGLFVAILGVESTEQLGGVIRPTVLEVALAVLSTAVLVEIVFDTGTVQDLTELLEENGITNLLFLNDAEKRYILNWQFKHAVNPVPRQLPSGTFLSYSEVDEFHINNATSYKLFNRFQVKYLVDDSGGFAGTPTFIKIDVAIGDTLNPIFFTIGFPNPQEGQPGPRNEDIVIDNDGHVVTQINDGTPVQIAVDGFNGVAHPKRWNHIGSRITLGIGTPSGTSGITTPQVYPTYNEYSNLVVTNTFGQAAEPIQNFAPAGTLPYPPNEAQAPFIP